MCIYHEVNAALLMISTHLEASSGASFHFSPKERNVTSTCEHHSHENTKEMKSAESVSDFKCKHWDNSHHSHQQILVMNKLNARPTRASSLNVYSLSSKDVSRWIEPVSDERGCESRKSSHKTRKIKTITPSLRVFLFSLVTVYQCNLST